MNIQSATTKQAIRTHLRAQRNTLRREDVLLKSYNIFENFVDEYGTRATEFTTALLYANTENEVSTGSFAHYFLEHGIEIAFPRMNESECSFECVYVRDLLEDLAPNRIGIREPKPACATCDPQSVDVVLVPGIAFDESGNRIGMGHGYYDRFFAGQTDALRVGVCYDFQLREMIPSRAHDAKLDVIITETRVLQIKKRQR